MIKDVLVKGNGYLAVAVGYMMESNVCLYSSTLNLLLTYIILSILLLSIDFNFKWCL